jgi:hypothetical protein
VRLHFSHGCPGGNLSPSKSPVSVFSQQVSRPGSSFPQALQKTSKTKEADFSRYDLASDNHPLSIQRMYKIHSVAHSWGLAKELFGIWQKAWLRHRPEQFFVAFLRLVGTADRARTYGLAQSGIRFALGHTPFVHKILNRCAPTFSLDDMFNRASRF